MKSGFKKTAFNALLPALMMAQPGFASVRSSTVSRNLLTRAVVVTTQSCSHEQQGENVQGQSNPFAAFGQGGAQEEIVQSEPAAETFVFLADQGFLQGVEQVQATKSGDDFDGRKVFASLAGQAAFDADCDATGSVPAWHATPGRHFFRWQADSSLCYINDRTQNPMAVAYTSGVANCNALHLQCKAFAPTNAAPVATTSGGTTAFTEGSAVVIDSGLTVTDADTPNMASATVSITGGFQSGQDSLGFTNQNGITGSYSSGILTLTGTATVAQYQAALRSVTYNNSSDAPNTANRTISFVVNDGTVNSATVTKTVSVTAVNDAPTATNLTQTVNFTEDPANPVDLNNIVVTDPDTGDTITATLTLSDASAGSLTTGTFGAATSTYNAGTGVWSVSGSVANVNAALAAVAFIPVADWDQNITIATRIRDAAGTGPADGTISLNVTPVNDPPTDITLSANSILQSTALAGVTVGTLSSTDADSSSFTYSLITAATAVAGTCAADTGNGSFQINSNVLETAAALTAGAYSVCIQTSDGEAGFKKGFTITVTDDIAPVVSSVSVPVDAWYTAGQTLSFTVNTTENVIVTGTPTLPLTIGLAAHTASYAVGSGTTELTFSYTIQAGDSDYDGIAVGSAINPNSATLRDAAGNNMVLTLNAVGATNGVLVDSSAPTVQGLSPANGFATVAPDANFVMTFSENIALGTGNIVIYDALNNPVSTIDVTAHAGQLSVTDNVLTINPAADLNEGSSYYIQIASGAVRDMAGLVYSGIADSTSWNFTVVDLSPPAVTGIVLSGTPAANATTIQFTVTFNETVYSVSMDDFTLAVAGNAAGTIAGVTGSGTTYTVTVNAITGNGSLRLDLNTNTDIIDSHGNGNGTNGHVAAYAGGASHTVDRDPPATPTAPVLNAASDSGSSNTDGITNVTTPTITGTAEADSTVTLYGTDGITILGTETADGSGNWSITISNPLAEGEHSLTVKATDAAGNESNASQALTIQIDTTAPAISSVLMADTTLIAGETSLVTFTFSKAVTDFTSALTVSNGSLSQLSSADNGITWTATFTPAINTTALINTISVAGASVTDIAGNTASGTAATTNYTIDTLRPVAGIVVADIELNFGETSLVTVTFNRAVSGFTNDDVIFSNGTMTAFASMDGGITWSAIFTPAANTDAAVNVITLDNSGVQDSAGNTGTGTTDSNVFAIHTVLRTLVVTSLLDTGDDGSIGNSQAEDEADGNGLSLREALNWARNGDTITFDQGGDIVLNGSPLVVRSGVIIDGDPNNDGVADVSISANYASQVMSINSDVNDVVLKGLTLTQGMATGSGGSGGAGLYIGSGNSVLIRDSHITNNTINTIDSAGGGGIYGNNVNLTIINSTVSGNSANGLSTYGGGIRVTGSNSRLNLINTTVADNTTNSTDGHGGGIQYSSVLGVLTIINSTISGNAALGAGSEGGGLRVTSGTSHIYNSTIVGNAASGSAGGVSANGIDNFFNTVIAGNTAGPGAIAATGGSSLATGGNADDVGSSTIEVAINNYFGTQATISPGNDTNNLNDQGTDNLLLGGLDYHNGSSHLTHRPLTGSALLDAGSNADLPPDVFDLNGNSDTAEALPVDATGKARVAGNAVDIGAVEGNSAPVLANLDGGNTHTEGGSATVIDAGVSVSDEELDLLNGGEGNYSGASLSIVRDGGADADDIFGFVDGSGIALVANQLNIGGQAIASFDTGTDGQLTVTFTDANGVIPTRQDVNSVLRQLTYATASADPTANVVLLWTFSDEASTSTSGNADVTIALKNDSPTLTATGGTPTFTEGGSAVDLFSGVSVSTIEAAQTVIGLQLTVTNVINGSNEILSVDGSDLALTHGNTITTATNALSASVSVSATTATVSLSSVAGISSATAQSLVDGMTYRNSATGPSPLSRVVTLTRIQDNGGTTNGGVDTTDLAISATVSIIVLNNAPVIGGTPDSGINQDIPYSFVPTASDADGDTLTFTASNIPGWASLNAATGALTGTPGREDVGVYNGIVISVSDGIASATLPAFDIEVFYVNAAPVIMGAPNTSVNQDVAYSFIPTAYDTDVGDTLIFSISNQPTWANFNSTTGELYGTPTRADVGVTSGIVISVSDGALIADLPAFAIEVVYVNEPPVIGGEPLLVAYAGDLYSFTPTASDGDGDTLTFSASGVPGWLSLDVTTGHLSGVPGGGVVGEVYNITLSASDGTDSTALPVFSLSVEYEGEAPVLTVPDDVTLNAEGLYTLVNLRQLLGLSSNTSDQDLNIALEALASDSISGNQCCVTRPEGLTSNGVLPLAPGRHEVVWKTSNEQGLSISAIQVVNLRPLVSFSQDQIARRGTDATVRVLLNGPSPVYPLDIPFVVDNATTALPTEHDAVAGLATFDQPGQQEVIIPIQLTALTDTPDSELVLRLEDQTPAGTPPTDDLFDINAGVTDRHVLQIRANVTPVVQLHLAQNGVAGLWVTADGGPVTATAVIRNTYPSDHFPVDWSASDNVLVDTDGDANDVTWVFDPSGLEGRHYLQARITDTQGVEQMAHLYFRIFTTAPVLDPTADTDGDGIDDATEGYGDSKQNGIPDFLDAWPQGNVLPNRTGTSEAYLLECEPGLLCRLGKFALVGESGGAELLDEDLEHQPGLLIDKRYRPVGGVFDVEVLGLTEPGQRIRIVIPQHEPIPAAAEYRQFLNGEWLDFALDANNRLHSAPGQAGVCPPPGSGVWEPGLIAGSLCVQVTLQDGGPNDADGVTNAAVSHLGTVGSLRPVEPVKTKSRGGAMGTGILLLLGLLLIRRSGSGSGRGLAATALLLAAAQAQAGGLPESVFLQADFYQVKTDRSAGVFSTALAQEGYDVGLNTYDTSRNGYQLSVGYRWNTYTYTQLGYLNLGSATVDMSVVDIDLTPEFGQILEREHPFSGEGAVLIQGLSEDITAQWSVLTELGLFFWQSDVSLPDALSGNQSDRGVDPLLGLRVHYRFDSTMPIGISVGVRRIFTNQRVDLLGVALDWGF